MLICGYQSLVDVTTGDLLLAEDDPGALVEFKVHVESYGFIATRLIRIAESDALMFVSHLRPVERGRQGAVSLAPTPAAAFQLRIGFIDGTGRGSQWPSGRRDGGGPPGPVARVQL